MIPVHRAKAATPQLQLSVTRWVVFHPALFGLTRVLAYLEIPLLDSADGPPRRFRPPSVIAAAQITVRTQLSRAIFERRVPSAATGVQRAGVQVI